MTTITTNTNSNASGADADVVVMVEGYKDGCIRDDLAQECEPYQQPYKFLFTGIQPQIGQRTETQIVSSSNGSWCILSGIVTNVGELPTFEELENPNNIDETDKAEEQIQQDQQESSDNLEKGKSKKASESQQNAAGKMQQLAQSLRQMQGSMYEENLGEDIDDL